MNEKNEKRFRQAAKIVENRVGLGPTEIVSGWQALVSDLLNRAKPFLKAGAIVTFQNLQKEEITFFERLHGEVRVPASAFALFLPPSVRGQMMGEAQSNTESTGHADAGVILACPLDNFNVCVNALFAHPPFTPAVDVYEQGQMVAGYQYDSIDACLQDLAGVLSRHLGDEE